MREKLSRNERERETEHEKLSWTERERPSRKLSPFNYSKPICKDIMNQFNIIGD